MNYVERFEEACPRYGQTPRPKFVVTGSDDNRYVAECRRHAWSAFDVSQYCFFDANTGEEVKGWWKKRKLHLKKRLQEHLKYLLVETNREYKEERKVTLNDYIKAVDLVMKEKGER